jgi:hypothetical protein
MWHNASQTMRSLLAAAGAKHLDNIVVTHQGAPSATFVTTTRKLFSGKQDRVGGVLPEAGIAGNDLNRMVSLGEAIAQKLDRLDQPQPGSLLTGMNAVWVNRRYVVPEIAAWYVFRFWAGCIHAFGKSSNVLRQVGVFMFGCCLLCMILTLPIFFLGQLIITPIIQRRVKKYIVRLYEPTGMPQEIPFADSHASPVTASSNLPVSSN